MSTVIRHMLSFALPGRGEELRERMLAVAEGMRGVAGCETYVVGSVAGEPDAVAVSERWTSPEASEASLEQARASGEVDAVVALMDPDRPPQRVDVTPLGGTGHLPPAAPGHALVTLRALEDQAPGFGLGHAGEARFARERLGLTRTGLAHHVVPAGVVQPLQHVHANAEEVYVVLSGSGSATLDGEVVALGTGDALRVGPQVVRRFSAAAEEPLEIIAVGPHHPGDGQMTMLDG